MMANLIDPLQLLEALLDGVDETKDFAHLGKIGIRVEVVVGAINV